MKQFLIIGNMNAVTYKEVFPLIKDGKVRLGVNSRMDFTHKGQTEKGVASLWFTTLHSDHINPPIPLTKHYTPEAYPKYDNYDAIEVGRTENIPMDYYGVMGVPISFLDKWCTEQFEIIDAENQPEIGGGKDIQTPYHTKSWGVCPSFQLNGKQTYRRILIKHK